MAVDRLAADLLGRALPAVLRHCRHLVRESRRASAARWPAPAWRSPSTPRWRSSGSGSSGESDTADISHGNATLPHDDDTPEDRHRFLGFAALLLSALSAVAVIYAGPGHLLLQKLLLMRRLLLLLGLLTLAAVWLGPLADAARRAFSAHMLMHMGVVAVAAPLLALGVTGRAVRSGARTAAAVRTHAPPPCWNCVVVWTWHAPMLHHLARHSTIGLIAEQGMFLTSALLLWLSAYGGNEEAPTPAAQQGSWACY